MSSIPGEAGGEPAVPITLHEPLETMANRLLAPDRDDLFGPNLAVVEALGCQVAASVITVTGRGGRDALSLRATWRQPDGALGISVHGGIFCAPANCHGLVLTDREVTVDSQATAERLFRGERPDRHLYPAYEDAEQLLGELLKAQTETDILSRFGFNFDPWMTYFRRHTFPDPVKAAIELVRSQRGR